MTVECSDEGEDAEEEKFFRREEGVVESVMGTAQDRFSGYSLVSICISRETIIGSLIWH
jgi:hypothetical protein